MNPPFSEKYTNMKNAPPFIQKKGMRAGYYILSQCMGMSDTVIALMPWFTITDSDVRSRFFKEYGLKSLTSLPRKTFQYTRIQCVVMELVKGYDKATTFKFFNYE